MTRQLFSWWKRWPLWALFCKDLHEWESAHDEHGQNPKMRWVLGWCVDCGECREVDIR